MSGCITRDTLTRVLTLAYKCINDVPYLVRIVAYVSKAERVLYTKIHFLLLVSNSVKVSLN